MDSLGYAWGDANKPIHELMKEEAMAKKLNIIKNAEDNDAKAKLNELDDLIANVSQKATGKPKPKAKETAAKKPLVVKRRVDKNQ